MNVQAEYICSALDRQLIGYRTDRAGKISEVSVKEVHGAVNHFLRRALAVALVVIGLFPCVGIPLKFSTRYKAQIRRLWSPSKAVTVKISQEAANVAARLEANFRRSNIPFTLLVRIKSCEDRIRAGYKVAEAQAEMAEALARRPDIAGALEAIARDKQELKSLLCKS